MTDDGPVSTGPTTDRPAAGFGLPRTSRLRTDRDFRRTYSRGRRYRGQLITIVATRRQSDSLQGDHRVGLSVSKDHGRAVRRNKIKRLLREAFRLERPTLPGAFDLVLIPVKRDVRYELTDLRAELVRGVQTLERQPEGPDSGRGRPRGGAGRRKRGGRRGREDRDARREP